MNIARYLIFIFLLVSSFKFATNQCTFWTFSNVKATTESVNDSVIVQDYRNDCEFLCYENQLQCVAANIVVRDDGTYRCELILPNSTTNRRLVLSPNSGGKHISRISKNKYMVAVKDISACSASTWYQTNTCDKLIDNNLSSGWLTNNNQVGNWVKFTFSRLHGVVSIDMWLGSNIQGQCCRLDFTFSNDVTIPKERICVAGNQPFNRFEFAEQETNYVMITCKQLCQPIGWIYLSEISIYEKYQESKIPEN